MTTHSEPGYVASTQQLVANIGAAKESISIALPLIPRSDIGVIDAHTMRQGTFCTGIQS